MGLFDTLGISRKAAENMSEVGKQHAEFAQIAYAPPHARPADMNGYRYVKEMSDDRTALYVNDATKQVEMAFRGSVDERDWLISDMAIAMDIKGADRTFRGDEALYQQVTKQYADYGVQTTGHSLGGARSDYLAKKHNLVGHTYNLGARPTMGGVVDKMRCAGLGKRPGFCDNITHHHSFGDVISFSVFAKAGQTERYSSGGNNPGAWHGLEDMVGTVDDITMKYDAEKRKRRDFENTVRTLRAPSQRNVSQEQQEQQAVARQGLSTLNSYANAWYELHPDDPRDWSELTDSQQRGFVTMEVRD